MININYYRTSISLFNLYNLLTSSGGLQFSFVSFVITLIDSFVVSLSLFNYFWGMMSKLVSVYLISWAIVEFGKFGRDLGSFSLCYIRISECLWVLLLFRFEFKESSNFSIIDFSFFFLNFGTFCVYSWSESVSWVCLRNYSFNFNLVLLWV